MKLTAPTQLLWALIGLILTIGGTLVEAFIASPPWMWGQGVQPLSLGVTWQVGSVLLIGCVAGSRPAVISQIAYLLLGLTWFNVFTQGGGFDYMFRPTFGYLLGFVPGAWMCGWLAFRLPLRLEFLTFSSLAGLLTIHLTGTLYLLLAQALNWAKLGSMTIADALFTYSLQPLPGQLAVVCAVAVLAFLLRHLLLY